MVLLLYELVEYSEKVRAVMRRGEESLFFMYAGVQKQVLARVHLWEFPIGNMHTTYELVVCIKLCIRVLVICILCII